MASSSSSNDAEVIVLDEEEDEIQECPPDEPMQCVFEWRVRNFASCLLETDEGLNSPIFADSAGDRWFLTAYPAGQQDYEQHVSVHVSLLTSDGLDDKARGKVFCEVSVMEGESRWASAESVKERQELGCFEFPALVMRDELERAADRIMPADVLTLCCQLYDEHEVQPRPTAGRLRGEPQLRKFSDDFRDLFRSGRFCDVTLSTRDGTLTAHRVILAARSPEFMRRLAGPPTAEGAAEPQRRRSCGSAAAPAAVVSSLTMVSELRIPDFGKATVDALLCYIYSGELDGSCKVLPLDLYQAARKYGLSDLERATTPTRVFAQTEVTVERYTYEWRLKDFAGANSRRLLNSGTFRTGPKEQWRLSLQLPDIGEETGDGDIGVYLNKLWRTGGKKSVFVRFQMYLLDRNRQQRFKTPFRWDFRQWKVRHGTPRWVKRQALLQNADELLPGGALTICCELLVSDSGHHLSKITHSRSASTTPLSEVSDIPAVSACLGQLLESGDLADVTVKCAGKASFALHKAVLCARSPKFARFFETQDIGLDHFTVDVTGISRQTLKMLFKLIYTGEVTGLDGPAAEELYTAARYYEIPEARDAFAHHLRTSLTTENAFQMLSISAAIVEEPALKATVLDFICSHADQLMGSAQWEDFRTERPAEAREVFKYLAEGYRQAKQGRTN